MKITISKSKKYLVGLAGLLTLSMLGIFHLINSPLMEIDESSPKWIQKVVEFRNKTSIILEDKLTFKNYKWEASGFEKINTTNMGQFASNGKWTFYRDGGSIYRVKNGGEIDNSKKITDDFAYHINVTKEGVFYENVSDGNKLYKLDSNGENKKALTNDEVSYVSAYKDWLYYTNFSDGTNLYKIKPDGSGKEKVLEGGVMGFTIDNDYVYYSDFSDDSKLYRATIDGSNKEKMTDKSAWRIFVGEKYIYFQDSPSYEGKVYRILKQGGDPELVIDKLVDGYIVLNDNEIYYASKDPNDYGLYYTSIKDKKEEKLYQYPVHSLNLYDGDLFMTPYGDGTLLRLDIKTNKFIGGEKK